MEVLTVLFVICGLPLAIFVAGWMACYLMVVKYRFRMERRFAEGQQPGRSGSMQPDWQP